MTAKVCTSLRVIKTEFAKRRYKNSDTTYDKLMSVWRFTEQVTDEKFRTNGQGLLRHTSRLEKLCCVLILIISFYICEPKASTARRHEGNIELAVCLLQLSGNDSYFRYTINIRSIHFKFCPALSQVNTFVFSLLVEHKYRFLQSPSEKMKQ